VAKGAVVEIAPLVFAFYRFLLASAVFMVPASAVAAPAVFGPTDDTVLHA